MHALTYVERILKANGHTQESYNARQLSLYLGAQLAALADMCTAAGLDIPATELRYIALSFSGGRYLTDLAEADRPALLAADVAMVGHTLAAMYSQGAAVSAALTAGLEHIASRTEAYQAHPARMKVGRRTLAVPQVFQPFRPAGTLLAGYVCENPAVNATDYNQGAAA